MINGSKVRVIGLFALVAIFGGAAAQTTTTPAPDPCIGHPDEFLPHPTDCTKYYSCYGGKGYEQVCPDGKYFDSTRLVCDVAANVKCIVNNCPPDGIVFLPIPGVCDRYTICVAGDAFEGVCEEDLYFDAVLGDCNYKNESGCVVNPCTQPPPSVPDLEIHPNEGNCRQYVICLNGEPIIRDCAPDLFFDPNTLHCSIADDCIPETGTAPGPGTTVDPTVNPTDSTVDPTTDTTVDPTTDTTTVV